MGLMFLAGLLKKMTPGLRTTVMEKDSPRPYFKGRELIKAPCLPLSLRTLSSLLAPRDSRCPDKLQTLLKRWTPLYIPRLLHRENPRSTHLTPCPTDLSLWQILKLVIWVLLDAGIDRL